MPGEYERVQQDGCTIYSLTGFPGDGGGEYSKAQLAKLKEEYKDGKGNGGGGYGRALICSLNRNQRAARAVLEECGFQVIAITLSAHQKGAIFEQWLADGMPTEPVMIGEEGHKYEKYEPIWLMGRGFYTLGGLKPEPAVIREPVVRIIRKWF